VDTHRAVIAPRPTRSSFQKVLEWIAKGGRKHSSTAFKAVCHTLATCLSSINRYPASNWPELLDAALADADVPVVEVDGWVAMAGDEADLVAEAEAVGGAGDAEAAVLVGGALVGGGGLVPDERRP
jgi:hypothetical protein